MLIGPQNLPESIQRVRAAHRRGRRAATAEMWTPSHSSRSARGSRPKRYARPRTPGVEHFGENYVQEALEKMQALRRPAS